MVNPRRTSGLHAVYFHETHSAGGFQAPGYSKLCRGASIFGQMNQSLIVEINVDFTEVRHECDGGDQKPGEIKSSRNWSRFPQVHLERGPWVVDFVG
jgi:hypothetical protein